MVTEMMYRHNVKPFSVITIYMWDKNPLKFPVCWRLLVPSDYAIILFAKEKLLKILLFRSLCEEGWLKLLVVVQRIANYALPDQQRDQLLSDVEKYTGMDGLFSANENVYRLMPETYISVFL